MGELATSIGIEDIRELYDAGRYMDAYERITAEWGPSHRDWAHPHQMVMGGRLAHNLGGHRLAAAMHVRAMRLAPTDPEALYFGTYALTITRGWLDGWRQLRNFDRLPEAGEIRQADWLALKAEVAGRLRDFETADRLLDEAEAIAPDHPWIMVERASVLEQEDRYEESLVTAQRALEVRPWYRPAVQMTAHLLGLQDKDEQALQLLTEASEHLQSSTVLAHMASIQREMERYDEARQSLDRCAALCPMMDKLMTKWLAAQRCDVAYRCGDREQAIHFAREMDVPFYKATVERLENPPEDRTRKLLPVKFVRQHYNTCAPATLSAISRFWDKPAEHLDVAEAICYGGTPAHSERKWAEDNGWAVREFTVDWDSAVALIDRNIPFTLTTVDAGNAHLQAVVGYDKWLGLLLIRDSNFNGIAEARADELVKRYASNGPRGMAMVPAEREPEVDAVDLPDTQIYDRYYALQCKLQDNDREGAQVEFDALAAATDGHTLRFWAELALADYDADQSRGNTVTETLLKKFPDDANLKLRKYSHLRLPGRRDERLELLEAECYKKEPQPIFFAYYAMELAEDAREHDQALRLLRKAARSRPNDPMPPHQIAGILWSRRQYDEALELYRFAAGLEDVNENLMRSFFSASRHCRKTDEAVQFLRDRFERAGGKSSHPARTLYGALCQLGRIDEGLAVLDQAVSLRPDDVEIVLFAADSHALYGNGERAAELLSQVKGSAPRNQWLRTAANVAHDQGRLADALKMWQDVLQAEPLAVDAHSAVAQMLAQTEGPAAAIAHLRKAAEDFPYSYAIHELQIRWLREDDLPGVERVVRQLIEINPSDAWARRELASILCEQRRFDEAFEQIDLASELEPEAPGYFNIIAQIHESTGQLEEARDALRQAIISDVDNDHAIGRLLMLSDTLAERREALAHVEEQMVEQVLYGDGLLAYRTFATGTLEPAELLASLQRALEARQDLWHAWSAVIDQLTAMDQLDEALSTAMEATQRFPLLPKLWLDLAEVHHVRGEEREELDAIRQARQISPDYAQAIASEAKVLERWGDLDEAIKVIENAMARNPLEAPLHVALGDLYWKTKRRQDAIESVRRAVELRSGYEAAWERLLTWANIEGDPTIVSDMAREMTEKRPGDVQAWLILARTLIRYEDLDERMAAIDKAIELRPRDAEAYDLKADVLVDLQRYDEAIATCRPAIFGDRVPTNLQGRAAWVDARRGRLDEAIAAMAQLLEDDPHYHWGWQQLMDWYEFKEDFESYARQAGRMTELLPNDPMALTYRADGRARLGDRDGAKGDLLRAVSLSPEYLRAGVTLFEMFVEDKQLSEAEELLQRIYPHLNSAHLLTRKIELAARCDKRDETMGMARELFTDPDLEAWMLQIVMATMRDAGWLSTFDREVHSAARKPDAQDLVISLFGHRAVETGSWDELHNILTEIGNDGRAEQWALLAGLYIESGAEANLYNNIHGFINQHRDRLFSETRTWGAVGYALITFGEYHEAWQWLADWQQRDGVETWHLLNVATALRDLGRVTEARQVSEAALQLPPDHSTGTHELFLAMDEAMGGGMELAAARMERIDPSTLSKLHGFRFRLLQAMVLAAILGQAEQAKTLLEQARLDLPVYKKLPDLRSEHKQACKIIAHHGGGFFWGLWWSLTG